MVPSPVGMERWKQAPWGQLPMTVPSLDSQCPCVPVTLYPCHPVSLSSYLSLSPCSSVTLCPYLSLSFCHPVTLSAYLPLPPCHPVTLCPYLPGQISPCLPAHVPVTGSMEKVNHNIQTASKMLISAHHYREKTRGWTCHRHHDKTFKYLFYESVRTGVNFPFRQSIETFSLGLFPVIELQSIWSIAWNPVFWVPPKVGRVRRSPTSYFCIPIHAIMNLVLHGQIIFPELYVLNFQNTF